MSKAAEAISKVCKLVDLFRRERIFPVPVKVIPQFGVIGEKFDTTWPQAADIFFRGISRFSVVGLFSICTAYIRIFWFLHIRDTGTDFLLVVVLTSLWWPGTIHTF
jgi:hypothetical protein